MSAIRQVAVPAIAADVAAGLGATPKRLPPKLFYDARGSALFEEITRLPEYYLTRTERDILLRDAAAIVAACARPLTVVELGAGSAEKTSILLAAVLRAQRTAAFFPIDVSPAALKSASARLRRQFPRLEVRPIVGDYTHGVAALGRIAGPKLVVWLGSSIGNFEHGQAAGVLAGIRPSLGPRDALLLGADRVKSASVLVPAYNDAQGVTAAFNKNVLARINRELGGDFDLDRFAHVALWNRDAGRMEIYLESLAAQEVRVATLGCIYSFAAGERIHTENSYKYTPRAIDAILRAAGFAREQTFSDARRWFALHLARPR